MLVCLGLDFLVFVKVAVKRRYLRKKAPKGEEKFLLLDI